MDGVGFSARTQEQKNCDILFLDGRIDGNTSPILENAMNASLAKQHYKLVLDLAQVNYMSSSGLRILVSTSKTCRKHRGGDVRLAAVNAKILDILDLSGLDAIFQIYETVDDAVESFN